MLGYIIIIINSWYKEQNGIITGEQIITSFHKFIIKLYYIKNVYNYFIHLPCQAIAFVCCAIPIVKCF